MDTTKNLFNRTFGSWLKPAMNLTKSFSPEKQDADIKEVNNKKNTFLASPINVNAPVRLDAGTYNRKRPDLGEHPINKFFEINARAIKACQELINKYKCKVLDETTVRKELENFISLDPNDKVLQFNSAMIEKQVVLKQEEMHSRTQIDELNAIARKKIKADQMVLQFVNASKSYLQQNLAIIQDLNNLIIKTATHVSNKGHINDLDLALSLNLTREMSKKIAQISLDKIANALNQVGKGQESIIRNYTLILPIKEALTEYVMPFYAISQNGLQPAELVEKFTDKYRDLASRNGADLSNTISCTLHQFHQAIHGSLLQKDSSSELGHELAELDPEIIQSAINKLLTDIIRNFEVNNNDLLKQPDQKTEKELRLTMLDYNIKNLQLFLSRCGKVELDARNTMANYKNFSLLPDKSKAQVLIDKYDELRKTYRQLGNLQAEEIASPGNTIKYPAENVLNLFNNPTKFERRFERIVLETSLLAAFEVIDGISFKTQRDSFLKNHPQSKTDSDRRQTDLTWLQKLYPESISQGNQPASLPWLKAFYEKEKAKYQEIVKKEKSLVAFASVADTAADLAEHLRPKGLFSGNDFFNRYQIKDFASKFLNDASIRTSAGGTSRNLGVFFEFFSNLDARDPNSTMRPIEIKALETLVKQLRRESALRDKKTNELIHEPKAEADLLVKELYNKLKNDVIGKPNFIMNNAGLIMKFFKESLDEDRNSRQTTGSNVILEYPNILLASQLLYTLIKYFPHESDHIAVLKTKMDLVKLFVNGNFHLEENRDLRYELYEKLRSELFGIEKDNPKTGNKDGRLGIVRSLCKQLQEEFANYASKKASKIPLTDLLVMYFDLENLFKSNPEFLKVAKQINIDAYKDDKLFVPFDTLLESVLFKHTDTIIEFIKDKENKANQNRDNTLIERVNKLKNKITNMLLEKSAQYAEDLEKNLKIKDGVLQVYDSDEASIKKLIALFAHLKQIGGLLNRLAVQQIEIYPELFADKDNASGLEAAAKHINKIINFKQHKIALLIDERISSDRAAFPDQFRTKKILSSLLNEAKMEIAYHKDYQWHKANRVSYAKPLNRQYRAEDKQLANNLAA